MYQLLVGFAVKLVNEKIKRVYSSLVASVCNCFPAGSISTHDGLRPYNHGLQMLCGGFSCREITHLKHSTE